MYCRFHSLNGLAPILASFGFGQLAVSPPLVAQERIVVVIDSSRSMKTVIGGRSKLDAARDAVSRVIRKLNPDSQVGIIAYGHRGSGCTDIETIHRLSSLDRGKISRALNRLRPKGRTPLGEAVRRAAKELGYDKNRSTVVLVSDGEESCGADPCQIGKDLENWGLDFTAHVVGLDIEKKKEKSLRCLAEITGGKYIAASNPRELDSAILKAVRGVEGQVELLLSSAAKQGKADLAKDVIGQGIDVDAVDKAGWTPLMHAAFAGDLTMVDLLLEAGADPSATAGDGATPILAAVNGNKADSSRILESLVHAGADPDAKDRKGYSPLMIAVSRGNGALAGC